MINFTLVAPARRYRKRPSALLGTLLLAFTCTAGAQASGAGQDDFEKKWQELIKAAQEEGELSIAFGGLPSRMYRTPMDHFSKKFGIKVVTGAGSGRKNADRILAERKAGRYTVDVIHIGANTTMGRLVPAGVLDPLEPELFHPEVMDKSRWYKGRWWWADPERKYSFIHAVQVNNPPVEFRYNTNLVTDADIEKITSVHDYLDDKWKGKIVSLPPTLQGAAESYVTQYFHPELGKEYLTRFITEMDVNFVTDFRQISDGLARGKYAIAINVGAVGDDIRKLAKQGLPIGELKKELKEAGVLVTSGAGLVGVANNRPHPNAAKLFVNWWLSHEGQTVRQEMADLPTYQTLRIDDIPMGTIPEHERRKPSKNYLFPSADPAVVKGRAEAEEWAAEVYRSSR
jgi:iron(III) transport system substrate-binding protein